MKRFGEFIFERDDFWEDVESTTKRLMLMSRGSRARLKEIVEGDECPLLEKYDRHSRDFKVIMNRVYEKLEGILR